MAGNSNHFHLPEISDNTTIIRFQVLNLAVDAAATADGIQVPQIQILGGAAAQFIQARAAPVITNTVAESVNDTALTAPAMAPDAWKHNGTDISIFSHGGAYEVLAASPVCNIGLAVFGGLSQDVRTEIRDLRERASNRERNKNTAETFPGNITMAQNEEAAGKFARTDAKRTHSDVCMLYGITPDFRLRDWYPRSAASAVVLLNRDGKYQVHSKSPDMRHVKGAEDAILLAAILALEKLIREANRRFANGVHIKKAKFYLNHKNLLNELKQTFFAHGNEHTIMTPAVKEFWRLAYLVEKAGSDLWLHWLHNSDQVLPHVIADWAVKNHHHKAEQLAMEACQQSVEKYRELGFIPRIDDLHYPIAGSGDLVTGVPHPWNGTQARPNTRRVHFDSPEQNGNGVGE